MTASASYIKVIYMINMLIVPIRGRGSDPCEFPGRLNFFYLPFSFPDWLISDYL